MLSVKDRWRHRMGAGPRLAFIWTAIMATAAQAQIIDADTALDDETRRTSLSLTLFSDSRYATNALARSNLPGGLEDAAASDVVWAKGVNASVGYALGNVLTLFAGGTAFHTNFFKNSELDYVGLSGVAGVQVRLSRTVSAYGGGLCVAELAARNIKRYYSFCGPMAGISLVTGRGISPSFDMGVRGVIALGDTNLFARYRELQATIGYETGGRTRLRIRPTASVRSHSAPAALAALNGDRTDYNGSIELGMRHLSGRFEIGLAVQPSVNWSNYAQYHFWDVRGGPIVKVMF